MPQIVPTNPRHAAKFAGLVKVQFVFLEQLGFRVTSEEGFRVQYEDSLLFVLIFRAWDDYYMGCDVGMLAKPKDRLSISEIRILENAPHWAEFHPRTLEDLEGDVPELARRLEKYGRRALAGDPAIFEEGQELRRKLTAEFLRRPPAQGGAI